MYVFFLAYPMSFARERGWEQTRAGLPLLAILIGCILGSLLISFTIHTRLAPSPEKGRARETRMLLMMIGVVLLPAGIFGFGATSSPNMSAWPQIFAGVPIGIGIILINMQGLNYIIDCYSVHANSAIAANTFLRSLFASGFPVFATSMYTSLGVEKASMIIGGLGVLLTPIPVLFFYYGEEIRKRSKWVPN